MFEDRSKPKAADDNQVSPDTPPHYRLEVNDITFGRRVIFDGAAEYSCTPQDASSTFEKWLKSNGGDSGFTRDELLWMWDDDRIKKGLPPIGHLIK